MLQHIVWLVTLMTFVGHAQGHESVGLTIEIANNEKTCFYEDFKKIKRYIFSYQVLRGGLQDIDVTMESPNKKLLYRGEKAVMDTFDFETSWGLYTICFSNEFSNIIHKVVYFELRPEEHRPLAVEAGVKRPSVNTQIEETMEDLHRLNSDVIRFQREYRLKESQGRFLAETINKGVFWYSLGQTIIVVFIMVSQVLILKCFFTEHRKFTMPEKGKEVMYAQPVNTA